MISISNNGQAIAQTNYWSTAQALSGYCFLSRNAAALRLLLPKARSAWLKDILAAKKVTIERSVDIPGGFDVVFEDGTDMPFFIAMSPRLIDRKLSRTDCIPFTVWTEDGLMKSFVAKVTI